LSALPLAVDVSPPPRRGDERPRHTITQNTPTERPPAPTSALAAGARSQSRSGVRPDRRRWLPERDVEVWRRFVNSPRPPAMLAS
jgi:hypothetical protein